MDIKDESQDESNGFDRFQRELIRRHLADVRAQPDNFEYWEKLVRACEQLDGGINRNSHPWAIEMVRSVYNRFLRKYPLLFGYWKKYAKLEFIIGGTECAELVYERGCASVTNSVDLWMEYCSFKMETCHDAEIVRELFERAADHVGIDFLSHPFWDKWLEYEERLENADKILAILKRVTRIPMHQYARYYKDLRTLAVDRPLQELVPAVELTRYRLEIEAECQAFGLPPKVDLELERDLRAKIAARFYAAFQACEADTNSRWAFEAGIKRPYFHVTELDHAQLATWRKYLDFQEAQGDYAKTVFLYNRCLVSCACYDEFWFRYVRWIGAQKDKEEEVRHIYIRAAQLVPVTRPGIRLQFAYFEESCGRVDIARAIYKAILRKLPESVETTTSWANLERRQIGVEAAVAVYKARIDSTGVDPFAKAALVTEWATLLWKAQGSVVGARRVYQEHEERYADSRQFWQRYMQFEMEQPISSEDHEFHVSLRLMEIIDQILTKSRLSPWIKQEFTQMYMNYVQQRRDKAAMKEFISLDRDIPQSVSRLTRAKFRKDINGLPVGGLDEATRVRAEKRYYNFYELHRDPDPNAEGPAPFY
ncbi:hypothetical protein B0T26DRAFT_756839 [Lasiosphaeria miniovina]|uniref:Pre-mRNA-processing factor 39 n=1 Tax=Lasiosphaeria miniovina TaxID=1954250 RepID=A0AA40DH38_9PEZI|nr:uncharacterized protein B0T26DRAFT_756839 [Lasiosphaeria miniovina]KAK0703279.1 hypothetical protein B0T26DRAFT_756839 [Lasiosphaeria miniovina]